MQPTHRRREDTMAKTASDIYAFEAESIGGRPAHFASQRGKVLLIVNTASKCGFTPQYEGLEALHRELAPRGFAVLGFPCNQFGAQEPGDANQIATFCESKYDVTFPMFEKIEVNGFHVHPLFDHLKKAKSGLLGPSIKWNFTKFLVDRNGKVVARHAPTTTPQAIRKEIEALL
jgi:glutathione peroxidase